MSRRSLLALLSIMLLLVLLPAALVRAEDFGQQIEQQLGLYPDFAANIRVQYIGNRLALAAGLPNLTFKVFNDRDLNAMALPDGRIYVTSRMATVVTDDELAYVLGHEITHVKEGHAKNQSSRATTGAILGAILVGVLGGSASDIRMGADIAGGLTLGHYSRKDEYRADAGGIRLMSQCGYDPQRAADAMQRLIDLYGRGDAKTPVLGWFATHPDSQNRKKRLLDTAQDLQANPLPRVASPFGIEVTFDPSAVHAQDWAQAFVSYLLVNYGAGRAAVPLPAGYTIPVLPQSVLQEIEKRQKSQQKDDKDPKANEPLPTVIVVMPKVPVGFRAVIALRQVPAGGAATMEAGIGTAVEAQLSWTQISTGMTGTCAAYAQRRDAIPWMAQEELKDPEHRFVLDDGRNENIEGTLEAKAIRRICMAFAEVLEADGPVDHAVPVTMPMKPGKIRQNDYVYVVRGNLIVAEVRVDAIPNNKEVAGTVLWGVHTWKKKDRFIAVQD